MNWCYVYLSELERERSDFYLNVPIRTAKLLEGTAKVHVVYFGNLDERLLTEKNIRCHKYNGVLVKIPVLKLIGFALYLAKVGRKNSFDVVQNVWRHYFLFPIRLASLFADFKIVARIVGIPIRRSSEGFWKKIRKNVVLAIERLSLKCADEIQLLSDSLKEEFEKRNIDRRKMSVISQGIDTDLFTYKERAFSLDPLKIIYVGRISPEKGIDDLIQAVSMLDDVLIDRLTVTIAGDPQGDTMKMLQQQTTSLGIEHVVHWKGYVPHNQLVDLYHSHSLLVLPSKSEGLPNVIMEGMSAGIPCLATTVGEIPILLKDNRGILASPNNPKEISTKIKAILKNEISLRNIAKKSRNYIINEHSFSSLRYKYLQFLK